MFAKKLTKGDTIGILSLAGCVKDEFPYEKIEEFFDRYDYRVKFSAHVTDKKRYLAGDDDTRVRELEAFFEDESISAILSSRGGYGTLRMLDKINYDLIAANRKIFCGYSDITNLLNVFYMKTGLVTYHGPFAVSDFGVDDLYAITVKSFFDILEGHPVGGFVHNDDFVCINPGMARGVLVGGNLATILSLMGTPFEIDFEEKILLLEDVSEPLYKIDRMLTQLRLCGVFDKVRGVVIAKFSGCGVDEDVLKEFLREFFEDIRIPVFYGFDASHVAPRYTLPIGVEYMIDAERGSLRFI